MTNTTKLRSIVAIVLLLAGTETKAAHYTITIPADDTRIAKVTARLMPDSPEFYMFPGANQLPARWATFVSDFEVRDENNEPLPLVGNDDGTWELSSIPDSPVTLSYKVSLDHEQHEWSGGVDGAAYWREWGVFYTTRSLFVVNGEDREDITVSFELPDNWRVTAPWEIQGDDGNHYVVPTQGLLATSMFFAGTHKEVPVRNGPFEFLLALGGEEVLAKEDVFVDMAGGVLDYYVSLMGDVPRLESRNSAGKPVVIINQAEMTDGEAIGDNISILLGPSDNPMSQQIAQMLFAHEFFHLWNGKSFFPSGEDGEWFKEGFSNYYTLKALQHTGYLDNQAFLGMLGGFFYSRYEQDDAVGRLSITRGDLKHEHWGLVYCGGLMVAVAQDLQIRAATGNEKSLDDLMRFMFNEYGDNPYEVADIERVLSDLNGSSQQAFFARYVYGAERIPIAEFLVLAGIQTVQADGHTMFRMSENSNAEVRWFW
jgi:predicted metalloprotease with PDZ domain